MLGRVVEQRPGAGPEDDGLEVVVGLAVDEVVELVDVGLVVLAVVQLERLAAEVRVERIDGVREGGRVNAMLRPYPRPG